MGFAHAFDAYVRYLPPEMLSQSYSSHGTVTEHSFSDYIIIIIIIVVADTTWTYCTYTAKLTTPGADAQNAKRAVTKSDGLRAHLNFQPGAKSETTPRAPDRESASLQFINFHAFCNRSFRSSDRRMCIIYWRRASNAKPVNLSPRLWIDRTTWPASHVRPARTVRPAARDAPKLS